jgi:predicted transcriptional regulator
VGKLSVLGAQRIKALTEVLKDKQEDEIAELRKSLPSIYEIEKRVREEFGVGEYYEELEAIKGRLEEITEVLETKTGDTFSLSQRNSYNKGRTKYVDRKNEIKMELTDGKVEAIKRKYRQKEQKLWLCETLEEAKEIVGIE